MKNMAAF